MRAALVCAALLAAGGASASQPSADACAANLDANGKAIYAAARPGVAGGGDVRATVQSATITLVQSGAVPRAAARAAAQAAGRCLVQL
jgi:hypothetical protein